MFRDIRNAGGVYAIRSIIAAGIYSMTHLRTSNDSTSVFNSGIHIKNSNFTQAEVGRLLQEFAKDHKIKISDDIIENIFARTNGYVN